jgi:hypothetical protein
MSAPREVLFRAKSIDWDVNEDFNIWLEGHYVPFCYDTEKDPIYEAIIDDYGEVLEIDRSTLCQFTGLYDSTKWEDATEYQRGYALIAAEKNGTTPLEEWNGVRIWEGDIVDVYNECSPFGGKHRKVIQWVEQSARFYPIGTLCDSLADFIYGVTGKNNAKVIGNIFDNPELMEETK